MQALSRSFCHNHSRSQVVSIVGHTATHKILTQNNWVEILCHISVGYWEELSEHYYCSKSRSLQSDPDLIWSVCYVYFFLPSVCCFRCPGSNFAKEYPAVSICPFLHLFYLPPGSSFSMSLWLSLATMLVVGPCIFFSTHLHFRYSFRYPVFIHAF